jgi:hypothetical protein
MLTACTMSLRWFHGAGSWDRTGALIKERKNIMGKQRKTSICTRETTMSTNNCWF